MIEDHIQFHFHRDNSAKIESHNGSKSSSEWRW